MKTRNKIGIRSSILLGVLFFLQLIFCQAVFAADEAVIRDVFVYNNNDFSKMTVVWKTASSARGYVWYKEATATSENDWKFVVSDIAALEHSVEISGLKAETTYFYFITALDGSNTLGKTEIKQFSNVGMQKTDAGKPDLVLKDMYYISSGDAIYPNVLAIKVCNEGTSAFANIQGCVDGKPLIKWEQKGQSSSTINDCGNTTIDAGSCKIYTGNISIAKSGTYEFSAIVDPENSIDEGVGETSNNALSKKIVINLETENKSLPDLVPTSMVVKNATRGEGQGYKYGDLVDVAINIKNEGAAPSGEFVYKISGYNQSADTNISSNVLSLGVGESVSMNTRILWPQDSENDVPMTFAVDTQNSIAESNEENNILAKNIQTKKPSGQVMTESPVLPNIIDEKQELESGINTMVGEIGSRGKFIIFLVGPDLDSIEALKGKVNEIESQITKMQSVLDQIQDENGRNAINEQIDKLKQEKKLVEGLINEQEEKGSMFGWLIKLFR